MKRENPNTPAGRNGASIWIFSSTTDDGSKTTTTISNCFNLSASTVETFIFFAQTCTLYSIRDLTDLGILWGNKRQLSTIQRFNDSTIQQGWAPPATQEIMAMVEGIIRSCPFYKIFAQLIRIKIISPKSRPTFLLLHELPFNYDYYDYY